MSNHTIRTSLSLALWDGAGEHEVEAVIRFEVTPGESARWPSATDRGHPEEPPEVWSRGFELFKPSSGKKIECPRWLEEMFWHDPEFTRWLLTVAEDENREREAENRADFTQWARSSA